MGGRRARRSARPSARGPSAPATRVAASATSPVPRGRQGVLAGGGEQGLDRRADALGARADLLEGAPVLGLGSRSRRRARSTSAWIWASGVRSSCETSAVRRRSRRMPAARRSSRPSRVAARREISSCGGPTSKRSSRSRSLQRSASSVMRATGRRAARRMAAAAKATAASTATASAIEEISAMTCVRSVGLERDAGDDRPDPAPLVGDDGQRVQADVARHVDAPPGPPASDVAARSSSWPHRRAAGAAGSPSKIHARVSIVPAAGSSGGTMCPSFAIVRLARSAAARAWTISSASLREDCGRSGG